MPVSHKHNHTCHFHQARIAWLTGLKWLTESTGSQWQKLNERLLHWTAELSLHPVP
jgi:hypothetical protein